MGDRAAVGRLLERQSGVISRDQALSLDLSIGSLRGLVHRHEWILVHPAVYRAAAVSPHGFGTRVWAAFLWLGRDSVLTGAGAASWWDLTETEPAIVEFTVPPNRNPRSGQGVRVVRRALHPDDVVSFHGLQVAAKPFAAAFGAAALGPPGQPILDRALQRGVSLAQVDQVVARNPRLNGVRLVRRWMTAAADSAAAESERRLAALFRQAGLAGWVMNRWVDTATGPRKADFLFGAAKLIIEIDGWAFHAAPDRFADDRRRQNQLVLQGWTVLRFTWADIADRPGQVLAEVRAALSRRR